MALPFSLEGAAVEQGWFAIHAAEPGIFAIEEPLHEEQVKSHLIIGAERAVLIDTGMGVGDIRAVVASLTDMPITVVNSHAHWDHIGGNHRFDAVLIHPAEAADLAGGVANDLLRPWFQPEHLTGPLPDGVTAETIEIPEGPAPMLIHDGDVLDLGDRTLEVIHAPGHSPGGIALLDRANGVLFSTDVAYAGPLYLYAEDDLPIYAASLAKLAALVPDLRAIYPSHNAWSISPALLTAMSDALAGIVAGDAPSWERDAITAWEFDGFSVELKRAGDDV